MPKITTLTHYLGIDPGEHGGAALISRGRLVECCQFDKLTEHEIAAWFFELHNEVIGCLEKVWARPGNASRAAFAFGWNYGMARTLLIANNIPFEEPIPRTWQKALGIKPRDKQESITNFKNRLKAKAHELFPKDSAQINKSVCDAVLIAEWLRRQQHNGG